MYLIEMVTYNIRHSPLLEKNTLLWDLARPLYNAFLKLLFPKGIKRVMNSTTEIVLHADFRSFPSVYEPDVWKRLIREVREEDAIADVGASFGLYAVALAKRTGEKGRVYAFEPEPNNILRLKRNIKLNKVFNIEVIEAAAGDKDGLLLFASDGENSHVIKPESAEEKTSITVPTLTLDKVFFDKKIDIIKIDIEGYEGRALKGAKGLINRKEGYPRAVFIELHPWAWKEHNTTGDDILSLLINAGYRVERVDSEPVSLAEYMKDYGEIIAIR